MITEGVLTRMLQGDPSLEGVALVIFDEFHERNLHADLGLALCCRRRIPPADLRLLVMSATLAAEPVAKLSGEAPIVRSEGRGFPVTTQYLTRPIDAFRYGTSPLETPRSWATVERAVERAVRAALKETEGDILVFLPGREKSACP